MRRALVALAAVLAAVALVLAGCGGGDEPAGSAGETLAAAAANTREAGSSRLEFTATLALPTGVEGEAGALSGEGEFDYENQRGRLTLDLGELLSQAGLPGNATVDLLLDGTVLYLNFPLLTAFLPDAKEWLKIDLAEAGPLAGIDVSQLAEGNDPTQYLGYLEATGAEVEEVGTEQVRGVETTHYRATVDLQEALEVVPEAQRASVQALVDAGVTLLPIDAWVDGEELVRRIEVESPAGAGGAGAVTMELFDFGIDVSVEPPPADEVTDASELEGLLPTTTTP